MWSSPRRPATSTTADRLLSDPNGCGATRGTTAIRATMIHPLACMTRRRYVVTRSYVWHGGAIRSVGECSWCARGVGRMSRRPRGLSRLFMILVAVAALVAVVTAAPAGARPLTEGAGEAPSSAGCANRVNDTPRKLLPCIRTDDLW